MTAEQSGARVSAALAERIDPEARSRLVVREVEGLPFLEVRLPDPFRAVFTTRLGGESRDGFSSLNLDTRSEDDPAVVARNRAKVAALADRRVVSPAQAHGIRVVGASEYLGEPPGTPCDGLTIHPAIDEGLAALLQFADCVPVVLCSEVDLAVVHAGWRGLLGGVIQQGGRALMGAPGTAIIGPSIGPCCFTVADDVAAAFTARFGPAVVAGEGASPEGASRDRGTAPLRKGASLRKGAPLREGAPLRVDLWEAATVALTELAIPRDQVVNPRLCTACNRDFFYSYREEGPVTGRQGCLGWAVTR